MIVKPVYYIKVYYRLSVTLKKMFKIILDHKKGNDSIFAKSAAFRGPIPRQRDDLH